MLNNNATLKLKDGWLPIYYLVFTTYKWILIRDYSIRYLHIMYIIPSSQAKWDTRTLITRYTNPLSSPIVD